MHPGVKHHTPKERALTDLPFNLSPKTFARMGGVLYLIIIALGLLGEAFIRDRLIVSGNATATAANIASMESLWRFGIAAELFLLLCAVTSTWIFFVLLRPVNGDLALLAVLFNLVSMALEAVIQLNFIAVLFPLDSVSYMRTFSPEQRSVLAFLSARSYSYGFGFSLIFFAGWCLITGYLIFRSGYLPKGLGVLLQITGLCYLTNSFALLLAPDFESRIFPTILAPAFVGELSLALWLSLKGVNVAKWQERANRLANRWGPQVP
jgi:hypothetical protein